MPSARFPKARTKNPKPSSSSSSPSGGHKQSLLVSSTTGLRTLIQNAKRSLFPDNADGSTSDPHHSRQSTTVSVSWKNIWCAGYWEYTPLQYFLLDEGAEAPLPLEAFNPRDWAPEAPAPTTASIATSTVESLTAAEVAEHYSQLSRRLLIRPYFDDTQDGRVQRVERLYHHLADSLSWAPLNDSHCSCCPGPHAELAYILNGYRIQRHEPLTEGPEKYQPKPDGTYPTWSLKRCFIPREILLEGGRGSGKSEDFFLVLQRGRPGANKHSPPEEQCYLNHPAFRALILRKNDVDLQDFFDRVYRFLETNFTITACNRAEKNITLSSGAKLFFGHLKDEAAFSKYIGHEYHLIWIEELGLIAKEDQYIDIKTCARSGQFTEIVPLVCGSTNPGGAGAGWISDYYVDVKDKDGNTIPASTLIYNPVDRSYRIRIHSSVFDNPYTLKGGYNYVLAGIKGEAKRAQWLFGSWDARNGVFFEEFRKQRVRYCTDHICTCHRCEPPHAVHVVNANDPIPIHRLPQPYEPLILAGDIGFDHHTCFIKARMKGDGQLCCTGALVESGKTLIQWGVELAEWIAHELSIIPGKRAVLFLSPEAFGNRGMENTQAQQLELGIRKVLGQHATIVADSEYFTYEDTDAGRQKNKESWQRLNDQKDLRLVIRAANNKRVAGWNWVHELLRWESLTAPLSMQFDPEYAARLLTEGKSEEYIEYYKLYQRMQKTEGEILPKLIMIEQGCEYLIKAIPKLIDDEKKVDDVKDVKEWWNDVGDALRYLAMGYQTIKTHEPDAVLFQRLYLQAFGGDPARQAYNALHATPNQAGMALFIAQQELAKQRQRDNLHGFSVQRGTGRIYIT